MNIELRRTVSKLNSLRSEFTKEATKTVQYQLGLLETRFPNHTFKFFCGGGKRFIRVAPPILGNDQIWLDKPFRPVHRFGSVWAKVNGPVKSIKEVVDLAEMEFRVDLGNVEPKR